MKAVKSNKGALGVDGEGLEKYRKELGGSKSRTIWRLRKHRVPYFKSVTILNAQNILV